MKEITKEELLNELRLADITMTEIVGRDRTLMIELESDVWAKIHCPHGEGPSVHIILLREED